MWDCRGLGKLNSQSFQMSLNMQEIYFKLKAVMKWLFTITVRHIEMSGVLILSKRCGKSWKQLWGFLFFFFFLTANSDQVLHNGYIQTAISLLPVMFSLCSTHLWNVWTTANFFQIKVVILNEKKMKLSPLCGSVRQCTPILLRNLSTTLSNFIWISHNISKRKIRGSDYSIVLGTILEGKKRKKE